MMRTSEGETPEESARHNGHMDCAELIGSWRGPTTATTTPGIGKDRADSRSPRRQTPPRLVAEREGRKGSREDSGSTTPGAGQRKKSRLPFEQGAAQDAAAAAHAAARTPSPHCAPAPATSPSAVGVSDSSSSNRTLSAAAASAVRNMTNTAAAAELAKANTNNNNNKQQASAGVDHKTTTPAADISTAAAKCGSATAQGSKSRRARKIPVAVHFSADRASIHRPDVPMKC